MNNFIGKILLEMCLFVMKCKAFCYVSQKTPKHLVVNLTGVIQKQGTYSNSFIMDDIIFRDKGKSFFFFLYLFEQ